MTCTDCTCFVIDYGISITYVLPTGWMYHASYSIQYCISAAIPSIIIARQVFATRKRRHHHPRWSGEGKGRGGKERISVLDPLPLPSLKPFTPASFTFGLLCFFWRELRNFPMSKYIAVQSSRELWPRRRQCDTVTLRREKV